LDLPQPFGPTMPVSPGRISMTAGSAKLLKPAIRSRAKATGNAYPADAAMRANVSKLNSPEWGFSLNTKVGVLSTL